jgi:RND family efflux transporter MFP subunit
MTTSSLTSPLDTVQRRLRSAAATTVSAGYRLFTVLMAYSSLYAAPAATGPTVTVAPVELKVLADSDEITGHVEATETVELRARVSGHIDSVSFHAGQLVNKGDSLFTIDPRWYRAQFEAKRADELLSTEAISAEEADARHARAAEARAELATARLDLEHTEVRAPISGRISRAFITEGNLVSGTPGNATELATIVSVGDAYVYADMDEATFLKFNRMNRERSIAGADGRIAVDLELSDESGYPRHGFIESSDNRLNAATGSLTLRMVFPNPDGSLVPGLYARVRVPVSAPQPTLLVSEKAIETDQGQKFVLVVGTDHVASYRTVKLGGSIGEKRIVLDGLNVGDRVIVDGLQRVQPGIVVNVGSLAVTAPPAGKALSSL